MNRQTDEGIDERERELKMRLKGKWYLSETTKTHGWRNGSDERFCAKEIE